MELVPNLTYLYFLITRCFQEQQRPLHRSPDSWRALTHAAINTALGEAEKLCGGNAGSNSNMSTTGMNENKSAAAAEEGSKDEPANNNSGRSDASVLQKKDVAATAAPSSILAAVLAGGESMLARLFSDVESVANVALDDPVRVFVFLHVST